MLTDSVITKALLALLSLSNKISGGSSPFNQAETICQDRSVRPSLGP